MINKAVPLLFFLSFINAQIALPTFQAVHKPHTAVAVAESGDTTFSYTGAQQTFTVPSGVSTITIQAYGAQGGSNALSVVGGLGGYSTGSLSVSAGNTLYIYIGGTNAYNGGGDAGTNSGCSNAVGGVGGGASDVRSGGTALSLSLIHI